MSKQLLAEVKGRRMTLTTSQRRSITQRMGAVVRLEGEEGIVMGHYDDDIVYVDFGRGLESCYVSALEFIAPLSREHERGQP